MNFADDGVSAACDSPVHWLTAVATDAELEKYAEQAKQNETAERILQAGQRPNR